MKRLHWQGIFTFLTYVIAGIGLLLIIGTFAWQTPGIGLIGSLGGIFPAGLWFGESLELPW